MLGRVGRLLGGAGGAAAPVVVPPPTFQWLALSQALPPEFTFTRASSATRINSNGTTEVMGGNVPRFTHDQNTLSLRGLMLEEASTNLLLNSAVLVTQSAEVTATPHTLTFRGVGSVTMSGAASGVLQGTSPSSRVNLSFTPAAGTLVLTVNGDVREAQLEAQPFPTSYIPTTLMPATRARDALSISTALLDIAQSSLALRCAIEREGSAGERAAISGMLYAGNGNNTDSARLLLGATRLHSANIRSGNVAVMGPTLANPATVDVPATTAFAWGGGGGAASYQGGKTLVDAAAPSPLSISTFRLNDDRTGANGTNIVVQYLRLWSGIKLTPEQLQEESGRFS